MKLAISNSSSSESSAGDSDFGAGGSAGLRCCSSAAAKREGMRHEKGRQRPRPAMCFSRSLRGRFLCLGFSSCLPLTFSSLDDFGVARAVREPQKAKALCPQRELFAQVASNLSTPV